MGCGYKMSTGSSWRVNPINPIPSYFRILASSKVRNCWVSKIEYPNCTNYEGVKILVTDFNPLLMSSIDPHFTENSGVIARFEPTSRGWELAHECAERIM